MAKEFGSPVDFNQNEAQGFVLENLAADPVGPGSGRHYFNTVTKTVRTWNGTMWDEYSDTTYGKQIMVQRCQFLNMY